MKFLDQCPADATADLVYRACPMHLLEPIELIEDLQPGQRLEILSDYDGALGAQRGEIIFTFSGAEANNPAIKNYQGKSAATPKSVTP